MKVVAPGKVPSLGRGGSLASRQAILHSLVHIESWAVDLSWDIVARFGRDPVYSLPDAFLDDFVQVGWLHEFPAAVLCLCVTHALIGLLNALGLHGRAASWLLHACMCHSLCGKPIGRTCMRT